MSEKGLKSGKLDKMLDKTGNKKAPTRLESGLYAVLVALPLGDEPFNFNKSLPLLY